METKATMNLYDMAKQFAYTENIMDNLTFNNKMLEISNNMFIHPYVMLLCHERRDYTLFISKETSAKEKYATELAETLSNRGDVICADLQEDGAWEIWVRDKVTKENFAYYLFDYSNGIIEVK